MTTQARQWAILIGIDLYKAKPLKGAVRDAWKVKQYLENHHKDAEIYMFTASKPTDNHSSCPPEEPQSWPTAANIVKSMTDLTDRATAGDFVHIHFSGHGTRFVGTNEYGNKVTGDLALVFYEPNHFGYSYMKGGKLGNLLKRMVDKGIQVTLVLDCCFSGSVLRKEQENRVRTIAFNPSAAGTSPLVRRDVRELSNWLLDPEGYAILCACGPEEDAGEYQDRDLPGAHYGALTYMLDIALYQCGSGTKLELLYQHLVCLFHEKFPKQTPKAFGNQQFSLFQKVAPALYVPGICLFVKDGRICLNAGAAHGVCVGDEYLVYPPNSSKYPKGVCKTVRVNAVRGLNSDLVEIKPDSGENKITTGWIAGSFKNRTICKIPVQLTVPLDEQTRWSKISSEGPFLDLSINKEQPVSCRFQVRKNENMNYEFLDREDELSVTIPKIPQNRDDTDHMIMKILNHLTTFSFFELIKNENLNSGFKSSFEIKLTNSSGDHYGAKDFMVYQEQDQVTLRVENHGENDIFLSFFDLGPAYQVVDLLGNGSFSIPGKKTRGISMKRNDPLPLNEANISLCMEVPPSFKKVGRKTCKDILKVFITSRPSSFTQFLLGDIMHLTGDSQQYTLATSSDQVEKTIRDVRDQKYNPFEGEWWTETFYIHTRMRSEAATATKITEIDSPRPIGA